jgi:hypothetical protein
MNLRKTLGIALLLGGLVAYIRFFELPREEERLTADQPYRGVSPQEFSALTVRRGAETFRFINSDVVTKGAAAPTPDPVTLASVDRSKSWRLADVSAGGLDKGAINSLLTALVGFTLGKPLARAELASDPSVYGLKEPVVSLIVTRGNETREIRFGALNEYVSKRYVASGDEVYLIADGLFTAVDKARDQFRNRNPIDFADSELAAVKLKSGGTTLNFVSDDSFRWRMTEPVAFKVSDTAMANLARALRNIRVADFVDDVGELGQYGLAVPKLSVELQFRQEVRPEPLTIDIGLVPAGKAQEVFLRIANAAAVMRLPSDPTDAILKRPEDFRDRSIFNVAVDRVEGVTIERPNLETLKLERRGEEWTVNGAPGDRPFIEQVVRTLATLEAESFARTGAVTGVEKPTARISIAVRGPEPEAPVTSRVLVVGSRVMDGESETGYYGRVSDGEETFIIGAKDFKLLLPLKESLVKMSAEAGEASSGTTPVVE